MEILSNGPLSIIVDRGAYRVPGQRCQPAAVPLTAELRARQRDAGAIHARLPADQQLRSKVRMAEAVIVIAITGALSTSRIDWRSTRRGHG